MFDWGFIARSPCTATIALDDSNICAKPMPMLECGFVKRRTNHLIENSSFFVKLFSDFFRQLGIPNAYARLWFCKRGKINISVPYSNHFHIILLNGLDWTGQTALEFYH